MFYGIVRVISITLSLIYNGSFFYAVGKTTTIYEIGQTQLSLLGWVKFSGQKRTLG